MRHALFLLMLLAATTVRGQFRLASDGFASQVGNALNDSTYVVDVNFFSDLTGSGYSPNLIQVGYYLFSQREQVYRISAADDLTLGSARLTIVEQDVNGVNTEGSPVGQVMVYDPPVSGKVPQVPFGSTGATSALQAAVVSYNSRIVSGGSGGGITEAQARNIVRDSANVLRQEIAKIPASSGGAFRVTEAYLQAIQLQPFPLRVVVDSAVNIAGDLVLPKAVSLVFKDSAYFEYPTDVSIVINGPVDAGNYHIFRGNGKVKLNNKVAKVSWFGEENGGAINERYDVTVPGTNTYHAFRKARYAAGDYGKVYFPADTIVMNDDVLSDRQEFAPDGKEYRQAVSALQGYGSLDGGGTTREQFRYQTFIGAGIGRTVLVTPNSDQGAGIDVGPYREAGYKDDISEMVTYEPTIGVGQRWVDMKLASDADKFSPGDILTISGGASFYDQRHSHESPFDSIVGNRIYLTDAFLKNLDLASSSNRTETNQPFTQPAEGATVQVKINEPTNGANGGAVPSNQPFSIGNDLYELVSFDGDSLYTVRSAAGKGNDAQGTVIPAGTTVGRYRAIVVAAQATVGHVYKNMTVVGRRDGIILSNFYNVKFDSVEIIHAQQADNGGLTLNADGGAKALIENSIIKSSRGFAEIGQVARSMNGLKFHRTKFIDVATEITEFASGTEFIECDFYNSAPRFSGDVYNLPVIRIGPTSSDTRIHGCQFYVDRWNQVIDASGIVTFEATSGGGFDISNNRFYVNDVNTAFSFGVSGGLFTSNIMRGKVLNVFGASGPSPSDTTAAFGYPRASGDIFSWGGPNVIDNFVFSGNYDQFLSNKVTALKMRNTVITSHGPYDGVALGANAVSRGVLIDRAGDANEKAYFIDIEADVIGITLPGNEIQYTPKLGVNDKIKFNVRRAFLPDDTFVKDTVLCVGNCLEARDVVIPDPVIPTFYDHDRVIVQGEEGDTIPDFTPWNAQATIGPNKSITLTGSHPDSTWAFGDIVGLTNTSTLGGRVRFKALHTGSQNRAGVVFRAKSGSTGIFFHVANYSGGIIGRIYTINAGSASIVTTETIDWPQNTQVEFDVICRTDSVFLLVGGQQVIGIETPALINEPGAIALTDGFGGQSGVTQFFDVAYSTNPGQTFSSVQGNNFVFDGAEIEGNKVILPKGVDSVIARAIANEEIQPLIPSDSSLLISNSKDAAPQVRAAVTAKYPVRLNGSIVSSLTGFDNWMRQNFGTKSQVQDSNYVLFPERNAAPVVVDFPTDECVRLNTTLAESSTIAPLGNDSFRVNLVSSGDFKIVKDGPDVIASTFDRGINVQNVTNCTVSFVLDNLITASGGCPDGYRVYAQVFGVDEPDVSVQFTTSGEVTLDGMVPQGNGYVTDPAVAGNNDNASIRLYRTLRPNDTSTSLGSSDPFVVGDTLRVAITGSGNDDVSVQLVVTRYTAGRYKSIGGNRVSLFTGDYYDTKRASLNAVSSAAVSLTDSLCVANGDTLYVFGDSFTSNFNDDPDWPEMIEDDGTWPLRLVASPGWQVGRDILPVFRSSIENRQPGAIIIAAAFNDLLSNNAAFAPGGALENPDYAGFFTTPNVNNWKVLAAHIDTIIAVSQELHPSVPLVILNCAPMDPYLADTQGVASSSNFTRINFERYNNWLVERTLEENRIHYIDQYSLLSGAEYWIEDKAEGRLHPSFEFQRIIADYVTQKLIDKCD